jgi:hypothetical protein
VANEALTYSGLPPAGPFFVAAGVALADGATAVTLNADRMSAYIAEQVGLPVLLAVLVMLLVAHTV